LIFVNRSEKNDSNHALKRNITLSRRWGIVSSPDQSGFSKNMEAGKMRKTHFYKALTPFDQSRDAKITKIFYDGRIIRWDKWDKTVKTAYFTLKSPN
jgi:hypothetical protein